MHDSLTIALLQAREAAMSYFRPIVKRHNLTGQQWRIVRILDVYKRQLLKLPVRSFNQPIINGLNAEPMLPVALITAIPIALARRLMD